jgi:hypothetical protein
MKTKQIIVCSFLIVILALAFTACGDGGSGGEGDLELSGNITITPAGPVTVGTQLTANYTGTETVSYHWKRGSTNVGTNSTYKSDQTGSYTVTVSAAGYKSKTSDAVIANTSLTLTGNITISPAGSVAIGTQLTANYTGTETVSYQWNKDGTAIPDTTSTTYTPADVGSYTVTVSAAGYNSKTSAAITTREPTLADKLAWLLNEDNVENGETYTIKVDTDTSINPQTLSYANRNNITIILKGTGGERVVSLSDSGSLFTIESGVTLILDSDITLKGHGSNNRDLIQVNSNGTLNMKAGAKITGNKSLFSSNNSSGVYVNGGTFIMDGGEISGNTSSVGGGVYVRNSGTFTMDGGEISGNTSSAGGGVYVGTYCTFTMNNGEISGNTVTDSSGGGVYIRGGIFIMNDGKISNNTIRSSYNTFGGGVCIDSARDNSTYIGGFTMNGGEISGNIGTGSDYSSGGGVYVNDYTTFTMNGGEISGNATSASNTYGGGVRMVPAGTFRIFTGTVYGSNAEVGLKNTASNGAALYNSNNAGTSAGTAQYGTFSGETWTSAGDLSTTSNTIKVVNGVLQQ